MAAFFIIFAMNPSHRDTLPWTPLDTKPSSSQTLFNFRGVAWKMSSLQFSHSHNSNKKKKNRAQKQFVGRLKNVTSCLEERTRVYTRTAAVIQDVEMLKQPQHLRLGILICSSTVNASFRSTENWQSPHVSMQSRSENDLGLMRARTRCW